MIKAILKKTISAMCDYCDRRHRCKLIAFGDVHKYICSKCSTLLDRGHSGPLEKGKDT